MDPAWFYAGDYSCIGGQDGSVALHARDGIPLAPIGQRAGVVQAVALHPGGTHAAVASVGRGGSGGGGIAVFALTFSIVHGLYRSRYAFRHAYTEGAPDQRVAYVAHMLRTSVSALQALLIVFWRHPLSFKPHGKVAMSPADGMVWMTLLHCLMLPWGCG